MILISGPCVIESEQLCLDVAGKLKEITDKLGIQYVFKASFDKANRTSHKSFRGLGIDRGLEVLSKVKKVTPVLTDVHDLDQIDRVSEVVDWMQIPAFLCRQTDLIQAAANTGKPINIKKGQFLSPQEMRNVVEKAKSTGNQNVYACERGTSFGYNNLVVDMRSLSIMREFAPVIFDATHSVQQPGGQGTSSGGQRQFIPILARAAVAVGIDGLFMETHPNPDKALSDGPNSWPLDQMECLLEELYGFSTKNQ